MTDRPLRIAWLVYRGNPHCGGQGVYTRYVAREVAALGHHIEVLSGQPWPQLDDPTQLVEVAGLDLLALGHGHTRNACRDLGRDVGLARLHLALEVRRGRLRGAPEAPDDEAQYGHAEEPQNPGLARA